MNASTMRLVGIALAVGLLGAAPGAAEDGKKTFPDVPREHWAFDAVTELANGLFADNQGVVLKGYPDGTFQGTRAISRLEAAEGLRRLEARIQVMLAARPAPHPPFPLWGEPGPRGPQGQRGEPGPAGPPGTTPPEVLELQRELPLMRREVEQLRLQFGGYRSGLDRLREEINQINDQLGSLGDRVRENRKRLPVRVFIGR